MDLNFFYIQESENIKLLSTCLKEFDLLSLGSIRRC